jgi:predicted metal-binding membrane protein
MTGAAMTPAMDMGLASVPAMAAMMLPSAVPAIARRARGAGGSLGAPVFAGSYLAVWALVALAATVIYRPPSPTVAGALVIAAGLYELTPLKRECRRRCLGRVGSGTRFGVYCLGSSIGLMVVLIALDPMSVPLMCAVGLLVLLQKLLPLRSTFDVPVAMTIIALGVVVALT